jgi:hypothetical protein
MGSVNPNVSTSQIHFGPGVALDRAKTAARSLGNALSVIKGLGDQLAKAGERAPVASEHKVTHSQAQSQSTGTLPSAKQGEGKRVASINIGKVKVELLKDRIIIGKVLEGATTVKTSSASGSMVAKPEPKGVESLSQAKVPKGKIGSHTSITVNFEHEGKSYGKETVTRMDNKTQVIATLEKRMAGVERGTTEYKALESQVKALKEAKGNWASSNYFRDLVKEHGFEKACEKFAAMPINMRYQKLEKPDGTKVDGFCRLGVITDPRNGFTSLRELRELKGKPEQIKEKIAELRNKRSACENENQKASIDRAINELENIDVAIAEREAVLQTQFLQLLQTQVENKGVGAKQEEFTLAHLGLLNPKKEEHDKTGWMHIEANGMKDMAEIFKDANGKKIVFEDNCKAPYVDKDGNYHVQTPPGGKAGDKLKLKAGFLNVSVQGCTENTELQKQLNREGLENLGLNEDSTLTGLLVSGDASNYKVAEEVGVLLLGKGAVSISCQSAKDRTGLVASRLVQRRLQDSYKSPTDAQKLPEEAQKKFENSILGDKGSAALVVEDNTGISVLKINPKEFVKGNIPGISTRRQAAYFSEQILGKLTGKI